MAGVVGPSMFVHSRIAARTAPVMFALGVVFLICQAVLIVMWVEVPALRETSLSISNRAVARSEQAQQRESLQRAVQGPASSGQRVIAATALAVMCLVWPVVIAEAVYHWIIRPKAWEMRWFHFHSLMACICPSLRMAAKSHEMHGRLWLPGLAWQRPDQRLRRRLEQHFSIPMIGIALLILPVLVVEFFLKDQVARYQWLRVLLHLGTGVIWFAFAAEFILMVSIAEKKIDYVRRNWIDVAIIVLPFFSFMRSLRAIRGTRIAQLAKVPQITRLARAYRLRGTVLKAFRGLVILDVSARLFRTSPEKRLAHLRLQLAMTRREARLLRFMIARLEREAAAAESPPEGLRDDSEGATREQIVRSVSRR